MCADRERAGKAGVKIYSLLRPLLFLLPPLWAHRLTIVSLKYSAVFFFRRRRERAPVMIAGLAFPGTLGLAAGFDKNGEAILPLLALGFDFIEIGTVTPLPQKGHSGRRMWRLKRTHSLVNRLGFPNQGAAKIAARLARLRAGEKKAAQQPALIGVNIGPNAASADKIADYVVCTGAFKTLASYLALNISSPNTEGLRDFQSGEAVLKILRAIKQAHPDHPPLFLKIAPDLDSAGLRALAEAAIEGGAAGIIAVNTTLGAGSLPQRPRRAIQGGLSGESVRDLAQSVCVQLAEILAGRLPVIGVGGISSPADAQKRLAAGAAAVQIYTALLYQGPALARAIRRGHY